jgi:hypothetical protein
LLVASSPPHLDGPTVSIVHRASSKKQALASRLLAVPTPV